MNRNLCLILALQNRNIRHGQLDSYSRCWYSPGFEPPETVADPTPNRLPSKFSLKDNIDRLRAAVWRRAHVRFTEGDGKKTCWSVASFGTLNESAMKETDLVNSAKNLEQPLTLMFPGLGDHYVNMGRGLYDSEPVFREQMDKCAELLEPEVGLDIRSLIYPAKTPAPSTEHEAKPGIDLRKMLGRDRKPATEAEERLGETRVAQPALFIVEYALARLWQALDIQIDSMIGYSLGEYTAACLAGVLSIEDSLKLVARRAALIEELPRGAMLAVPMAEIAVTKHLGAYLSISAINGPEMTVVAGPPEEVEALEKRLGDAGTVCQRVQSRHAFHSKMMEPLAERMTALLADFKLAPPAIPYISNVTGTYITPEQATDPSYFATHLCRPVRFADGITELMTSPTRIFLEAGPGQTLSSLAISHPSAGPARSRSIVPSMRHPFDSQADMVVLQKAREKLQAARNGDASTGSVVEKSPQALTAMETELMAIWQKVLSVTRVEKADSFFALGGNSLVASRMLFRIFKSFRINLPLRRVYEAPTLEEMARAIEAMREGKENTAAPAAKAQEPTFIRYRLPNGMDIFHQNEGETKHFYEDIFEHRSYVRHGIRIPDGGTVFDVGGNIGLFTLFAAHEVPTAQIYTFEPAPPLFAILTKNVQMRGAKAELFNMGLSSRETEAPFTFYPQSSGMSSFYADKAEERHVLATIMDNQRKIGMTETDQVLERGEEYFDVRLRAVNFTARLRRVSDIIREKGVERIDLMKVDVQKAELEVLEGIDDADWPKFQQIVLEVHDADGRANHVASLLQDRGFSVRVEQDTLYVGTNIHNIYAVREGRAREEIASWDTLRLG